MSERPEVRQTETLMDIIDQALDESRPTPERRREYRQRASRLMWREIAMALEIVKEAS